MKLSNHFIAMLLCGFCVTNVMAQTPAQPTVVMTLEECIAAALNDNPTIKVANMEIEKVDYSKKEVIASLLPTISFDGTFTRTISQQVMYMDASMAGGGSSTSEGGSSSAGGAIGIKVGRDNNYQMGFSASLPLIAPQLWKTMNMSDVQMLQTLESSRATKLKLVNSVELSYYNILLAKDSYAVIKKSYDVAAYNYDVYKKKFDNGVATEYDVLRSSVQVHNLESSLFRAEKAIKQAKQQLKLLIGVSLKLDIDVAKTLANYASSMYDDTMSIDTNINNNTDLVAMDLQTQYLDKALTVQKMAWYPTLALAAKFNWNSSSNGSPFKNFKWDPYSYVALSLSVPIFEGGARWYKQKQAKTSLNEMAFNRQYLIESLNLQVDAQIDNIQTTVKQVAAAQDGVKQAEKALQIMQRSVEIGAATYIDLHDAETALTTARLTYYEAIFNYLSAKSNLQLLLGNTNV